MNTPDMYYKWIGNTTEDLPINNYQEVIDFIYLVPENELEYGVALSGALVCTNFDVFRKCDLNKWADRFVDYILNPKFSEKIKLLTEIK